MYNYFINNFLYQNIINILRREELYIQIGLFKRVWVIVIIVLFFGIIAIPFTSGNFSVNNDNISKIDVNSTIPTNSTSDGEVIDQQQIDYSGGALSFDNNHLLIQSFQPAREWITKIELYFSKSNRSIISKHILISIREEINGFDLVSFTMPSDIIQIEGCWLTCDISKLKVVEHQTYYLVCRSINSGYKTGIYWHYNNDESVLKAYPCGTGITCPMIHKNYYQGFDFAFKIYGSGDGDIERWAIAMGAGFDSCRNDARALQYILHNNTPEIWPLDHFKIYDTESNARWAYILEGLRWIESREDENDITLWQSACHGWLTGLHDDHIMLDYQYLNNEFDQFDGKLVVMICACYSYVAHDYLAKEGRIIMTGRSESLPDMRFTNSVQKTIPEKSFFMANTTFFFQYFLHPEYGGAWGNDCCDIEYGNSDGWISAEEAFAFVLDIGEWFLVNMSGYLYPCITDLIDDDVPITSLAKSPPQTPRRPTGITNGVPGIRYKFQSQTFDPDGDRVYYLFDWGDGSFSNWLGPYESGTAVTAYHRWTSRGQFNIKVKAKDELDGESDWSDPLIVSMLKRRPANFPIFLKRHVFEIIGRELLWKNFLFLA